MLPLLRSSAKRQKKSFLCKRMRKANKQKETKGISDYLYITHDGSQILNRDPIFYYTGEYLLKVLFEKDRRETAESKKYLM